ncbi:hypothetical protein WJX72_002933 [[Myrmecia] bisecta]|uniref:Kinesin-like protein n=1 Tax=[Myrmecia] bisecta TaxID=41462 RepID=A0AAW1PKY7_9CHLO
MDRRTTRIPQPPGNHTLMPLTENDLNTTRKRKISPLKPIPENKLQRGTQRPPEAPAQVEDTWEAISEETGWTLKECLNHKLLFKKRDADKAKNQVMGQHLRRLRAAGRHLLTEKERLELDVESLQSCLATEEAARAAEAQDHVAVADALQRSIADLQERLSGQEQQTAQQLAGKEAAAEELRLCQSQVQAAQGNAQRLQHELACSKELAADYQKQVVSLTELHQHAQKYNSQLQEYNNSLQGEVAASAASLAKLQADKNSWAQDMAEMRGTLTALEANMHAAQTSAANAEAARHNAAGDAARLRSELSCLTKERDQLLLDLAQLKEEVARYKACTGQTVEILEREKELKAQLQSQNQAQAEVQAGLLVELAVLREHKALSERLAAQQGGEAGQLRSRLAQVEALLAAAEQQVQEGERTRRKLHNTILELKGNIRVFCRVRPLLPAGSACAVAQIQYPTSGDLKGRGIELQVATVQSQQPQTYDFAFDRVFGCAAKQEEVFEEISQLVQSALDGYKVCIFAYGQTGSGKTHTLVGMLGSADERGMIPRAMDQVFVEAKALESQGWNFEMRASMLEIYNEEIRDLLGKGPPASKKHQVSHDDKGNTSVAFLESVDVRRPGKVGELLAKAMKQRAVGATAANAHSSRSHMVFQLTIAATNAATGQQATGTLNLIDLAGSERLSKSQASGERLKETQNINKSLSALGDVIMALAGKEPHVPYRNSKLTYLLQPCLGGDAKTLMFVNVAPEAEAAQESLCSLRFAAKVNACEIGTARRNVK